MPSTNKTISPERPPCDEWGIYDPEQAGLAAVLDRIQARRGAVVPATDPFSLATSMREAGELTIKIKK